MNSLDIMRALCSVSEETIDLRFEDEDSEPAHCIQQTERFEMTLHSATAKRKTMQSPNPSVRNHSAAIIPYIIAIGCTAACIAGFFFLIHSDYPTDNLTQQSGSQDAAITQLVTASLVGAGTNQAVTSTETYAVTSAQMTFKTAIFSETVSSVKSTVLQTTDSEHEFPQTIEMTSVQSAMTGDTELITSKYTAADMTVSATTAIITESTTISSQTMPTHIIENGVVILFWEEKTLGEKYLTVSGTLPDGTAFNGYSKKTELNADRIGEYLGKVQLSGFDAYTDSTHYGEAEAYRIRDNDSMIAVKSDEDDCYYLYALQIVLQTSSVHSEPIPTFTN